MKLSSLSTALLFSLFASASFAQVPATAPAGTTGMCKDGSFSNAASKAGACSGHKGIKTWYAAEPTKAEKKADAKADAKSEKKADVKADKKADAAAEKKAEVKAEAKAEAKADKSALEKKGDIKEEKKAEPMKAAAPAPTPAASPAAKAAPAAPAVAATAASKAAPANGAPANSVWVNTDTKVYHCPGTRFYGKTKIGSYMTEAEATAKGSRPDHGKACGK